MVHDELSGITIPLAESEVPFGAAVSSGDPPQVVAAAGVAVLTSPAG
jgi:hypothetical protein